MAAGSERRDRARGCAQSTAGKVFELDLVGQAADAGWVREQQGVTVTHLDGGFARFEADSDEAAQAVLAAAVRQESTDVRSFSQVTPSLAQIFKEVIR